MDNPVIVSAVRTPIGKFLGTLAGVPATEAGRDRGARSRPARRSSSPGQIDEVIMGNVVSAGLGQNPARQAAIFGGIPDTVPAMTVNKVCGSGPARPSCSRRRRSSAATPRSSSRAAWSRCRTRRIS